MGCLWSCFKAPSTRAYPAPNLNASSRIPKRTVSSNATPNPSQTTVPRDHSNNVNHRRPSSQGTLSTNATPNTSQTTVPRDHTNNVKHKSKAQPKDEIKNINYGAEIICPSSEEEDVCPTCLEEYTPENPKFETKCCHAYHLSCIFEWKMRSDKCPICAKVLEVESLTFD